MGMIIGCKGTRSSVNTGVSVNELASTLQPRRRCRCGAACCIVGGGPGGMMLALLLARRGVSVTLLEAHRLRDAFARCTMPPSWTHGIAHDLSLRPTLSTFRRCR
jgi:hypothetical protein